MKYLALVFLILFFAACSRAALPQPTRIVYPPTYTPAPTPTETLRPPTATLVVQPPTATPFGAPTETPAPPHARWPPDTSTRIGRWADVTNLDAAQWERLAPLVQIARGGNVSRGGNLNLVTLAYLDTFTTFTSVPPDWLLRDIHANLLNRNVKESAPLLNFALPAVQQALAKDARTRIGRTHDGIFLAVGALVGEDQAGIPINPTTQSPWTPDEQFDATAALLTTIKTALPDKLVIASIYAWRDGAHCFANPAQAEQLAARVDGVAMDDFLRAPATPNDVFKNESAWKQDVDALARLSAAARVVLVQTTIQPPRSADPAELTRWADYSVASFLLGKQGAYTFFNFGVADAATFTDLPVFRAPLGPPLGSYTATIGIYRRVFKNGLVLVNPTNDARLVTLTKTYYTVEGAAVEFVRLDAHSGVILLESQRSRRRMNSTAQAGGNRLEADSARFIGLAPTLGGRFIAAAIARKENQVSSEAWLFVFGSSGICGGGRWNTSCLPCRRPGYSCSRALSELNSETALANEPALTAGSPGCNSFANGL